MLLDTAPYLLIYLGVGGIGYSAESLSACFDALDKPIHDSVSDITVVSIRQSSKALFHFGVDLGFTTRSRSCRIP